MASLASIRRIGSLFKDPARTALRGARGVARRRFRSRLEASALALGAGLWGVLLWRPVAQATLPGDVYYKVHVDQSYKPGPFVQDLVVWENADVEGIAPTFAARHDTLLPTITVTDSVACGAVAGRFTADLFTQIVLSARTGIWNSLANSLRVEVYIKGGTGTPYHVELAGFGDIVVSRLGGLPGTLQPLNGISMATFMGTTVTIDSTGVLTRSVFEPQSHEGYSQGQITVEGETYSRVGAYVLQAPVRVTQTYCILGCMGEAADFQATSTGHVEIDVYPCEAPLKRSASWPGTGLTGATAIPCAEVPTEVPGTPPATHRLALVAAPNPFNPSTVVSFEGRRGEDTRVEVLDARGRAVACLFDARATGELQTLTWQARGLASGVYSLRVRSGGEQRTRKLTLLK